MVLIDRTVIRHSVEASLLKQALAGDSLAVNKIFLYLSSDNPHLRQIIQESIHDIASAKLWKHLLKSLAIHSWEDGQNSEQRVDQEASQRIDQAIAEVFTQDEYVGEHQAKEAVLKEALNNPRPEIRYAAAYILGLRGDTSMVPLLDEILDKAVKSWKVRAVQALSCIDDERCGAPLIKALAMDRGTLHSAAKSALIELGPIIEKTWVEALNHPDSHIRWHAARSLSDPTDMRSMEMLAEGLLDENREVRWASADTLARIGPPAIPATLAVISRTELNTHTRQSAYHALHGVYSRRLRERLRPLLDALQSSSASVEAPGIAYRLLQEWDVG
jgi:HEAT repeat protein